MTSAIPTVFIVTPTYARYTQKADLTRLSQTLQHVPHLCWIVIEDSVNTTSLVQNLLEKSGLKFIHLNAKNDKKCYNRGVDQRNAGIKWIREHHENHTGVVYFADDDNTYNIKLFEEMRYTSKVSIWPVGLVGGLLYEGPVCENNTVVRWVAAFQPNRTFCIDMAGFAVSVKLLVEKSHVAFVCANHSVVLEEKFLTQLQVTVKELEPKANMCKEVLVWHTRTSRPELWSKKNFTSLEV